MDTRSPASATPVSFSARLNWRLETGVNEMIYHLEITFDMNVQLGASIQWWACQAYHKSGFKTDDTVGASQFIRSKTGNDVIIPSMSSARIGKSSSNILANDLSCTPVVNSCASDLRNSFLIWIEFLPIRSKLTNVEDQSTCDIHAETMDTGALWIL